MQSMRLREPATQYDWMATMRAISLLSVIVLLLTAVDSPAMKTKGHLLDVLYNRSGMEKQVNQLAMVIQVSFDQAVASDDAFQALPRAVIEEMRAAIAIAYDAESIKRNILSECHDRLAIGDVKQVLGWLESTLGRKLTRLEESASSPEAFSKMQRYALTLQHTPPSAERLAVIRRLDTAMKATDTGVEIAMNTQAAVAMAVVASLPAEQQPSYSQLAATLEQQRPQIKHLVRNQTLTALLFTYRGISDAELVEYSTFSCSPSGARYHNAFIAGLGAALLDGGYKWGQNIAEILRQSGSRTDV